MSKRIRLRAPVSLLLASMFWVSSVTAQQAAVAPANAKSAAIAAATQDVLQETSEIRQLSILRPVKSGAQSRAEIERMIIKSLDEEATPAELRADELVMKKLGLAPQDFQYRAFLISLLTEQVAGYYDPKAQQFYLADWIDLEGQLPVMAHELTHALQDQHFNLRRFDKWPKGDSDAALAAHALIEGDAMVTMFQYVLHKPERAKDLVKSMNGLSSSSEKIDSAPRSLRDSLLFPYEQGGQFVMQLYRNGGWKTVSQAFTDLPQSTEQILHSDKYFAREAPVKIELPDISKQLGKGWRRIEYDVNGEWGYYLILDEYLKSSGESEQAAAGWGGDRYALYEGPQGELVLAQLTAWDTEDDAREFYKAYVKRSAVRYGITTWDFSESRHLPDAWTKMKTPEGALVIQQTGSQVLVLEGMSDKMDASVLEKSIWNNAKPPLKR